MRSITKNRKIWFALSGIAVLVSIISFAVWGLNLGIDFSGGSLLEVEYQQTRPEISEVSNTLKEKNILNTVSIQPTGELGHLLRFEAIAENRHQQILEALNEEYGTVEEKRFDSIGPVIGQELKEKTVWAIIIVLVAIIIYISWAFRKISKPVPSWQYGLIAIIALFHDLIIVIGIFSILGKFYNLEVNAPFVAALLTILGYSVNDTIVIFDRTRENLARHYEGDFEDTVERSIEESIVRSINSSLTTLLVLLSIFIFGGQSIRNFILALILGIIVGTYSSIFLASPLLVFAKNKFSKR